MENSDQSMVLISMGKLWNSEEERIIITKLAIESRFYGDIQTDGYGCEIIKIRHEYSLNFF